MAEEPEHQNRRPRTLLEKLIREREATYEEQAKAFLDLARRLNEPATITVRHLQRLAAGQRSGDRAAPSTRRVMRQMYGHSLDELLAPPPPRGAGADHQRETSGIEQAPPGDIDLDRIATLADSADALDRLTSIAVSEPGALNVLAVIPEMWRATVVRWLLDPSHQPQLVAERRDITSADVAVVREATRMFSGWDYQYGGGRSRLLVAQCLATEALPLARAADTNSPLGREYVCAVSALTRLAGWTAYDIGLHGAAQRFLTLALNLAHEAADRALGGRILAGMSHQANYLGQYRRAVELARAAHEGARGRATPTTLSLFYAMEARAHASLGDERSCVAALTSAERLLADGSAEDDPEWIQFFDVAELHAEFAHCFRDLGQAELAGHHAALSIRESDPMYVRSLSFCRTVLATAHLQRRDVEQALAVARGVVDTATQLRSRRIATYLDDFRSRLAGLEGSKEVGDFNLYLAERLPALEPTPMPGRLAIA